MKSVCRWHTTFNLGIIIRHWYDNSTSKFIVSTAELKEMAVSINQNHMLINGLFIIKRISYPAIVLPIFNPTEGRFGVDTKFIF